MAVPKIHKLHLIEEEATGERFVELFGAYVPIVVPEADFEAEFDTPVVSKLSASDFEKLNVLRGWEFSQRK